MRPSGASHVPGCQSTHVGTRTQGMAQTHADGETTCHRVSSRATEPLTFRHTRTRVHTHTHTHTSQPSSAHTHKNQRDQTPTPSLSPPRPSHRHVPHPSAPRPTGTCPRALGGLLPLLPSLCCPHLPGDLAQIPPSPEASQLQPCSPAPTGLPSKAPGPPPLPARRPSVLTALQPPGPPTPGGAPAPRRQGLSPSLARLSPGGDTASLSC